METKTRARVCLSLILCLCLSACAGMLRSYGRFEPSNEVKRSFMAYEIKKDFRYYISGPELNPTALMGLHASYRLDPATTWREFPMTPERMRGFVEGMNAKVSLQNDTLHGFDIVDNTGKTIGVWYSLIRARTFIQVREDGTIRIDTPDLDTYEKKAGSLIMDTER